MNKKRHVTFFVKLPFVLERELFSLKKIKKNYIFFQKKSRHATARSVVP